MAGVQDKKYQPSLFSNKHDISCKYALNYYNSRNHRSAVLEIKMISSRKKQNRVFWLIVNFVVVVVAVYYLAHFDRMLGNSVL